jgi:hypothetical protein
MQIIKQTWSELSCLPNNPRRSLVISLLQDILSFSEHMQNEDITVNSQN